VLFDNLFLKTRFEVTGVTGPRLHTTIVRLEDWLRTARVVLENAEIPSAALEAQVLAAQVLSEDRSSILAHPEWNIDENAANALLTRRARHEPLAYIVGYREFYGRRFQVTPEVLIPRQETETLIMAFFEVENSLPANARILDLGTGSGCVGITLKLERPTLSVTLSDISFAALQIARDNARELGAQVATVRSDGFTGLQGKHFEAIISNPPYVAEADALPVEIRDFEPHIALYSGSGGLEFYERFAGEAAHFLTEKGIALLEVGDSQAKAVRETFQAKGWRIISSWFDLAGTQRVVGLCPGKEI